MRAAGTAFLVVLVTLAAVSADAQTTSRNELTIFGGFSLLDAKTTSSRNPYILPLDPTISPLIFPPILGVSRSLGGSAEFGARYGRDVTDALTITGDFSIAPSHELSDRVSFGCPEPLLCIAVPDLALFAPDFSLSDRVVAYHYGGGLRLNVLPGTLTPSVTAGLGGVTFAGPHSSETSLAFRIGGGLSAAVRNLTTGLEVVDVVVSDHFVTSKVEHDVHIRITFGVRW
jgi:hypothetical protein